MPEARGKPWSTEYMETYQRKSVPKPPTYKRGSNHNSSKIKKVSSNVLIFASLYNNALAYYICKLSSNVNNQ